MGVMGVTRASTKGKTTKSFSRTTKGPYGDAVSRQRLAGLVTYFGQATSLDIIGYTTQPPDVTRRLAVPFDVLTNPPPETHFQHPLFDK